MVVLDWALELSSRVLEVQTPTVASPRLINMPLSLGFKPEYLDGLEI